jgi:hypothetical protein
VRQLRAVEAGRVFREVASGAKTDRPQLRRLLSEIGPGDVMNPRSAGVNHREHANRGLNSGISRKSGHDGNPHHARD